MQFTRVPLRCALGAYLPACHVCSPKSSRFSLVGADWHSVKGHEGAGGASRDLFGEKNIEWAEAVDGGQSLAICGHFCSISDESDGDAEYGVADPIPPPSIAHMPGRSWLRAQSINIFRLKTLIDDGDHQRW